MTALLALERCRGTDADRRESVNEVPLVREGLRTGERVQAWKLFYALLLYSGNDDANELAISAAGSVRAFLRQMNEEARARDARHALLDPDRGRRQGNYSTAWDMAILAKYDVENPRFRRLVQTPLIQSRGRRRRTWKIYVNTNRLLHVYPGRERDRDRLDHDPGDCLVASATRHGRR